MNPLDLVLWRYLAIDIVEARLPLPPRVPSFARETVRPARGAS